MNKENGALSPKYVWKIPQRGKEYAVQPNISMNELKKDPWKHLGVYYTAERLCPTVIQAINNMCPPYIISLSFKLRFNFLRPIKLSIYSDILKTSGAMPFLCKHPTIGSMVQSTSQAQGKDVYYLSRLLTPHSQRATTWNPFSIEKTLYRWHSRMTHSCIS